MDAESIRFHATMAAKLLQKRAYHHLRTRSEAMTMRFNRMMLLLQRLLMLAALLAFLVGGRVVNSLLPNPFLPNIMLDLLLSGGLILLAVLVHEFTTPPLPEEEEALKTETPEA